MAIETQARRLRAFRLFHSADDIPAPACDSLRDVVKKAARGLVTPQFSRGLARDTGRVAAEYVQDASPKSPARLGSAADVTKARLPVTGSELAAMKTRFGNRLSATFPAVLLRRVCVLIALASAAAGQSARAEAASQTAALISFLDKQYKPGLLKIGNRGRRADGNYVWGANFPDELKVPSQKLGILCSKQAGAWSLLMPAVEIPRYPRSVTLRFGNDRFLVTRTDLWVWARGAPMRNASVEFTEGRGFGAMFDYRLIADRTRGVAEANASPPLGLFGCSEPSGNLKWAASIMPGHYGGNSWLYLTILPVTHDFLADIRHKNQELQQKTAKLNQDAIASAQEADRVAAVEEVRLQPWREQLKIGDQTNCGMVVDVRGPLLEMQLPPYLTGPNGIRRFWVQRSQITDKPAGIGCRFGA